MCPDGAMPTLPKPRIGRSTDGTDNLERLLDQLEQLGQGRAKTDKVSIADIVAALGPRSFGALLLVPSLAIVSPLSAIPTVPTVLAAMIGLVAAQIILDRPALWMPGVLLRRQLANGRLQQGLEALRPLLRRLDPYINERLTFLTDRPGNLAALLLCCVIAFFMPMIEFVPFLTSIVATAMALFGLGIFVRDGLLMLAGYGIVLAGGLTLGGTAALAFG
ncbi:MAG: exopolysaccharide biosynthesis protein [Sediminimonas qiaohouensis]|uniref:Exopolysaccharide biosynthesis protein n=2 Tax=Sediminimonas qiaohouensis TaxID=552061 RepID=A0A7C9LMZ4_9RHOB|nr:exopolysaccharide biosynthesis protein [Sediminimonas qiaohouensis]